MAYNYQKEKRAWTIWKEAEEKQLRDLGVDEQVIQKLHSYDWMIFNQNRQFYRHQAEFKDYSNQNFELLPELTLTDVQAMLDNIDNQRLLQAIAGLDFMSQKIIFYRIEGIQESGNCIIAGDFKQQRGNKMVETKKKFKKIFVKCENQHILKAYIMEGEFPSPYGEDLIIEYPTTQIT